MSDPTAGGDYNGVVGSSCDDGGPMSGDVKAITSQGDVTDPAIAVAVAAAWRWHPNRRGPGPRPGAPADQRG